MTVMLTRPKPQPQATTAKAKKKAKVKDTYPKKDHYLIHVPTALLMPDS